MRKYDPKKIEKKWQRHWEENKVFEVVEEKALQKFYALIEFPYPSGDGLHVGHPRPFTAMDVISRKRRMEGYNVLFPIGFDSFGLPTENYAIKTGKPPAEVTKENINNFTRQLKMLGFSFDWSRVVNTSDPRYYKWTQWIFLQLFKHGLAYKKAMPINWCLSCKIGLANEEVINGRCERCGGPVEKRDKEQWMLAITKYADKLLAGLKEVDYIPQAKIQQENWIGRSEGAIVKFQIINSKSQINSKIQNIKSVAVNSPLEGGRGVLAIEVFTTRPDTLFGATYMVVAPEHPLIENIKYQISNVKEIEQYIEQAKNKSDLERIELQKEKTGIELKGIKAINPANGEELSIFVADYVLPNYGTGAIMAVPAHDERDWEFAKKYSLPIREVVIPQFGERTQNAVVRDGVAGVVYNDENKILVLYDPKHKVYRLPAGGTEGSESIKEALQREITEESGYASVEIQDYLGKVEANFDSPWVKDKKRLRVLIGYSVKLKDVFQGPVSEEDRGMYEFFWLSPSEAINKFESNRVELGETEMIRRFVDRKRLCFVGEGVAINSGFLNGLKTSEAKEKMIAWLGEKGVGKRQVQYKLRDWVFSRQRYWGEPIPLVFCQACKKQAEISNELSEGERLNPGWIPLADKDLPLELPKVKRYEPTDSGESPLAAMEKWVKIKCPRCGGSAQRETDTMPNWAGSSWYFLRYCDSNNDKEFVSQEKLRYWMPVDWYNGGMEHTVLHLLYSRFWNIFLHDIGFVPSSEPYKKRTSHGMILAKGGVKMSKSKGNVVNPDEMAEKFGADASRLYIMFMGPFDQAVEWDTNGLVGVRRFLERVWGMKEKVIDAKSVIPAKAGIRETSADSRLHGNDRIITLLHQTIKKVTEDIEAMRFNTAIAKMMEFVNELSKQESIISTHYSLLLKILLPFAPHICEELWNSLGNKTSLAFEPWPQYDSSLVKQTEITLAVQVNGKLRDTLTAPAEISEEEAKNLALTSEKVQKWLAGKAPKKIIYVKGKLVSIVM